MNTAVSPRLVEFIRHECALPMEEEITANTRMYSDLGVYGDDAIEFLVAYAKTFGVDVTHFMAADYFKGEGADVLGFILSLFGSPEQPQKELTVGHLQKGIEAKRLDEQVIQGA
jgi:hypothetical protein